MKAYETSATPGTDTATTRKKSVASAPKVYDWGGKVYGPGELRGAPMPCQFTEEEFDEEIKLSEASGNATDEEVKALFARWGL